MQGKSIFEDGDLDHKSVVSSVSFSTPSIEIKDIDDDEPSHTVNVE